MSLKASSLKENEAQKKLIDREIRNILASIDEEIKKAHEEGKRFDVGITLPTIFNIPNLLNKHAQRLIYYNIIKSLIDREFIVSIDLQKTSTVIFVSWLSSEERGDIDLQNAMIARHVKDRTAN